MRIPTPIQALSAAAALALLAGCSSGSAIAPNMGSTTQSHHALPLNGRVPAAMGPAGMLRLRQITPDRKLVSFDNCPASGTIEYVSDFANSAIYIFSGNWSGQNPCGTLTNGLLNPQGMTVHAGDLYVANTGGENVLAFHRGQTTAFKTFTDTSNGGEFTVDVTVARDHTVIATNIFAPSGTEAGSISTWKIGGTFQNHYANPDGNNSYFLTVQRNGNVYFDDGTAQIYKTSCPLGVCGAVTATGASLAFPGGIRSAGTAGNFDHALLALDQINLTLDTFTTFPTPTTCSVPGLPSSSDTVAFDINHTNHHVYIANAEGTNVEMTYPGCVLKGTVSVPGSEPIGVAIDRPGALDD